MADMVRIEVDDAAVRRLFAAVQSRAKHLTPFFQHTGGVISQSIRHNFDVGGRYSAVGSWRGGGNRWKPLSADSFLARFGKKDFKKSGALSASGRSKAGNRRILQQDGHLLQSITFNVTSEGVEVGTNKVYASTHNFGAKNRVIKAKNKPALAFFFGGALRRPKQVTINIPARPFMVVQDEDIRKIEAKAAEFLLKGTIST